jgi:hypothetical protein
MANLSPSTVAINTIAHCLANALDAANGLDASMSADLRALLRVASGEIDRVRKSNRKAAAAAKRAPAVQPAKKAKSKRARVAVTEVTEVQQKPGKSKSRGRKVQAANGGIVTH